MYDSTEVKITEQVYLIPGIHKRQLSKQLKLGMPSIDYAFKKIDKLLKKEKSGNQIKYFLDYSKEALTPALSIVEYKRFERLPPIIKSAMIEFLKELKEKPIIAALFGSYAQHNYTKESDVDILLVYQKADSKNIENCAKKVSLRTNVKISPVYLDYNIFHDSFHNSTKEFFCRLKKDKIILAGIEWWRQLEDEKA